MSDKNVKEVVENMENMKIKLTKEVKGRSNNSEITTF